MQIKLEVEVNEIRKQVQMKLLNKWKKLEIEVNKIGSRKKQNQEQDQMKLEVGQYKN